MPRSPGRGACQLPPPAAGPHGSAVGENGRPYGQPRRRPGSGWRQESFRVTSPCPLAPAPLPPAAAVTAQPGRSANRVSPRSPVTQRAGPNHQLQQEEEGEEQTTRHRPCLLREPGRAGRHGEHRGWREEEEEPPSLPLPGGRRLRGRPKLGAFRECQEGTVRDQGER